MNTQGQLYREALEQVEKMPPMPHSISKVMEMTRGDEYSAESLANVVMEDPTLAARVLKLCNSGFFGLSQDVTSIHRAVVLIGFEMVKNLVLSSFVHSVLDEDLTDYAQSAQTLWEHSLGVATASLTIAQRLRPELAEPAYTAGLLHDIGKIALSGLAPRLLHDVLDLMRSERIRSEKAEYRVLGITHSEMGGIIAERWRMPQDLQEAIRTHHSPELAESAKELAAIVHVGDAMCGILGVGPGLEATNMKVSDQARALLGLTDSLLEEISLDALDRIFKIKESDALGAL